MGPHVLGLPQETVCERALEGQLQRVKIAVSVVMLDSKLAEVRQRTLSRHGVEAVIGAGIEKVVALAADIADHADKAVRKLLLNLEVPILVVQVAAQTIDSLRTGAFRLKTTSERRDWVREVWHIGGG